MKSLKTVCLSLSPNASKRTFINVGLSCIFKIIPRVEGKPADTVVPKVNCGVVPCCAMCPG